MVSEERLAAIGQLAAGFAHDLHNSLVPVVGFSELLLSDDSSRLSTRQREWLEQIHQGALDAAGTVTRLREAYRARPPREAYQPVDVTELFQLTVALTHPTWHDAARAAGKVITVKTESHDAPVTLGDEDDLRDALANLIANAVDAISERGTITLRGRAIEDLGAQAVALEVADSGIGMSDEARERCLEPFYTTKAERGTGLGLSLVHGTVQRHGGRIEIESQLRVGTAVRLILPAASLQPSFQPSRPASRPAELLAAVS
jgi:signal transduction histidine kinase